MKFEFEAVAAPIKLKPGLRFWFVTHPDTDEVGGGATKFRAVKDLEACVGANLPVR